MPPTYAEDRLALQDVMLNYARGVDERDRARYSNCFAAEVEVVGFGEGVYRGREPWVDYVWSALDRYSTTQHLLGPQQATIDGDSASTRSDVQALHVLKDGGLFTLWATYLTDMQRGDAGWQIVRHELVVRATSSGG